MGGQACQWWRRLAPHGCDGDAQKKQLEPPYSSGKSSVQNHHVCPAMLRKSPQRLAGSPALRSSRSLHACARMLPSSRASGRHACQPSQAPFPWAKRVLQHVASSQASFGSSGARRHLRSGRLHMTLKPSAPSTLMGAKQPSPPHPASIHLSYLCSARGRPAWPPAALTP